MHKRPHIVITIDNNGKATLGHTQNRKAASKYYNTLKADPAQQSGKWHGAQGEIIHYFDRNKKFSDPVAPSA